MWCACVSVVRVCVFLCLYVCLYVCMLGVCVGVVRVGVVLYVCVCVCVPAKQMFINAIFQPCLVSFHSWRNKLFLGVNQKPSVSNC